MFGVNGMKQGALKIGKCVLEVGSEDARLTAPITCDDGITRELWFSLPSKHAEWFSTDRCDGFVVGLILQAMERNENIVTEMPLSAKLWHSLQNYYIPMMTQAFPHLHAINIIPKSLTQERTGSHGVATGFSGGIDSFAAVVKHFVQETTSGFRVTHFLFHNVGAHGNNDPEANRILFKKRYEIVKPFADEIGLPIVPVDSNLSYVFPNDYVKTYSAVNPAVLLVLQNKFHRYFYASGYKYADCSVSPVKDHALLDPMAVHLLSSESLDCVSTGGEMSRVEKTEFVSSYEPSQRYLSVCVNPSFEGSNCSVCFKCRRTMLTLELLGLDHLYRKIFDFEKFSKVRSRYLKEILFPYPQSFEAEIAEELYAPRSIWWKRMVKIGRWIRKHRQYKK